MHSGAQLKKNICKYQFPTPGIDIYIDNNDSFFVLKVQLTNVAEGLPLGQEDKTNNSESDLRGESSYHDVPPSEVNISVPPMLSMIPHCTFYSTWYIIPGMFSFLRTSIKAKTCT